MSGKGWGWSMERRGDLLKLQKGKPMANYIYKPNMFSETHEGKMSIG
jgi:hypothetical protein